MKLDHVVYFTKKAPTEIVKEQQNFDWHTVVGGSHENWGTHNALMYLKNAYVEWLSVEVEEIALASNHPLVKLLLYDIINGESWGTICLSVADIEHFNGQLIEKGFHTSGVIDAERKTVRGDIRKWKMLFIEQEPSELLPFPFFIEWEKDEASRFDELRNDGTISPDNEALEVSDCLFSVNEPEKTARSWASILGAELIENHVLSLQNCELKFIGKSSRELKERLIDVSIHHR